MDVQKVSTISMCSDLVNKVMVGFQCLDFQCLSFNVTPLEFGTSDQNTPWELKCVLY